MSDTERVVSAADVGYAPAVGPELPPALPIAPVYEHSGRPPLPPEHWGRRFVRRLSATGAAAVMGAAVLCAIDIRSGSLMYPDNETVVSTVPGSENAPPDAEVFLVFGGLGQVDSATPAKEFLEAQQAAGKNVKVASIRYKHQGIDESDAEVIEDYLEENHVRRLGIVGISMGTTTALELLYVSREQAAAEGRIPDWKIADLIAYSSPADGLDPWQSEALHAAANTSYPGGMISKFIFNANPSQLVKSTPAQRKAQLSRAMGKTFNDCSPSLFMSQVELLDGANINKWEKFKDTFEQSSTFTYMQGEKHDDTVNDDTAIPKFFIFFGKVIGLGWRLVIVAGAGHADTARSAAALKELLLAERASNARRPSPQRNPADMPA